MPADIDRILPMRRTSEFSNPRGDEIIPRVFGNFLDTSVVAADDPNGGFTRAVCIDQANLVYAVNASNAVSTPPQVYFNGEGPQSSSVYIWNPAHVYEGRPVLATLQFSLGYVLNGEVSVRFGGSADAQGFPITNPLRGLVWMLVQQAGWTATDFDRGTCEQTIRDMDILGYPFQWAFQEDLPIREWLAKLLPLYHTDVTETGNGQLALILDRSLTDITITPDYHVPWYEIKDYGSPSTAVSSEKQFDDLVNQVTLRGRHHWVSGEPTTSFVADFVQSQASYRAAYATEFAFEGMYTVAHATQWLNSFFTRHGFEPRVVRFTMYGLKGTVLIPPRLITVECPPRGWVRRLMKVRKRTTSWRRHEVTLECIDCWRELDDEMTMPDTSLTQRRDRISRVYQWIPGTIGDGGVIEDAPGPSKNEAANGDLELGDNGQWKLTDAGGTPLWTIIDDDTKALQGRFYLASIPGHNSFYQIRTLRRRIDPREWVMVSGWFRDDATGADGNGQTFVEFYGTDGQGLGFATGNQVPPTTGYLESVLLTEAPAGAYHYIPGIQIVPVPTTGTWRADKIVASSGSRAELLTKRLSDLGSGNLLLNGDFEGGAISWNWQAAEATGWYLDQSLPLSGTFHATHQGEGSAGQGRRLYNFTRIILTPGQTIQVQGWWRTVGNPDGEVRFGMQFFRSNGAFLTELATATITGPRETAYVWWGQSAPVPTDAYYGLAWIETISHTIPNTYWVADDISAWFP